MAAVWFVAFVAVLISVTTARRMIRRRVTPFEMWPLLLFAAVSPVVMVWLVLFPGQPFAEGIVRDVGDEVRFDVEPGQALMATAILVPLEDGDKDENARTSYAFRISGDGFSQAGTGTIKRGDDGDVDAALFSGAGVQSSDTTRSTRMGEDLQDRYQFDGFGSIVVRITNWHGEAADALKLEIVQAPPQSLLVWGFVGLICVLGVWCDVGRRTDRLTTDVAFLAFWAAYLRDGVTPLDDWQEVGMAMAGALLSGWVIGRFVVGGVDAVVGAGRKEKSLD